MTLDHLGKKESKFCRPLSLYEETTNLPFLKRVV